MCMCITVHNCHTQHSSQSHIIFPLILHTIIIVHNKSFKQLSAVTANVLQTNTDAQCDKVATEVN